MEARFIRIRGVVQGVGFRPFVYRLAHTHELRGWVLNGEDGVELHAEGTPEHLVAFIKELQDLAPPAAKIASVDADKVPVEGHNGFEIRESEHRARPTVRISPDLPVCDDCLREMEDQSDRRYRYPYINCTNCGPRYTVIEALPYDRPNTTMKKWPLDSYCDHEYRDPANRRFHAQPVACPQCGPHFYLHYGGNQIGSDDRAIHMAAALLREGKIVATKGLGGYHLACDARNATAVNALRERKFRKEKPFAVMVKNLTVAKQLVELDDQAENLLTSVARPIVLAQAKVNLEQVAPENPELGVMLPYTPLHHLLFDAGAPDILVMTSANRSSEPIAYRDQDAFDRLSGIADAFLAGERPIARRVDDSVVRIGTLGPTILRRSRGYAPGAVSALPSQRPILAVGSDLKNSITLVVDGQAFVSQYVGDLDHYEALVAFRETIRDLVSMYELDWSDTTVAFDAHPEYRSTIEALQLLASRKVAVQHHRAHIASVLAEREIWDQEVLGVSFDGTGYGDDGTIWGGEFFVGSVAQGFQRIAHLRPAWLPGGDAAAQFPAQAAAGFLAQVENLSDLAAPPFAFPSRYYTALQMMEKGVRTFRTTSVGRLFDTAAALLGFTREITFEGQAAMWVEQLARHSAADDAYRFPFVDGELDFRPLLSELADDRLRGSDIRDIARRFQRGVARGVCEAIRVLTKERKLERVVLSGGVFQNEMLLHDVKVDLTGSGVELMTNSAVPANDGGISLGQAAIACFHRD